MGLNGAGGPAFLTPTILLIRFLQVQFFRGGSMMRDLWRLDVSSLTRLIRSKQVSAREVVDAALSRLAAVNPHVNAVVEILADEALSAAAAADAHLAKGEVLG